MRRIGRSLRQGQPGAVAMRQFFRSEYVSCTSFIAAVGKAKFGFDTSGLTELLKWADIVDGARFESAAAAVEMKEPALKIALVIENAEGTEFIPRVIPLLTELPLAEVLAQPFVQERVQPLMARHLGSMELIRERARVAGWRDLCRSAGSGDGGDQQVYPLLLLIPEAIYTVVVSRSSYRTKISVGTNPWTEVPADRAGQPGGDL